MSLSPTARRILKILPIYGCITTGLLYLSIGVIAMLSFLKIRDGGADENSVLAIFNDSVIGNIFVWIILLGTTCYIVSRILEAILDQHEYGRSPLGNAKRVGVLLSTIADGLVVNSAIRVLIGVGNIQVNGRPEEEQKLIGNLLLQTPGSFIVIAFGVVVLLTAAVQFLYGAKREYRERCHVERLTSFQARLMDISAWIGYSGRAIVLTIIGYFLIKAGVSKDASWVVNTDKAFDFVGDNLGSIAFVMLAVATATYGLFMIALGATYKHAKSEVSIG